NWFVNVAVFDLHERLLGIADLLEPSAGLVLESDGAGHREIEQHSADNAREEAFERHNLVVVRVGAVDHRDRDSLRNRIQSGYRDGNTRRRARDRWTLQKPGWWWNWPPGRRWD